MRHNMVSVERSTSNQEFEPPREQVEKIIVDKRGDWWDLPKSLEVTIISGSLKVLHFSNINKREF